MKYSDNISKGFATSLSIVLSFVAGVIMFDFHVTPAFLLGTALVVSATWLYNQPDSSAARTHRLLSTPHGDDKVNLTPPHSAIRPTPSWPTQAPVSMTGRNLGGAAGPSYQRSHSSISAQSALGPDMVVDPIQGYPQPAMDYSVGGKGLQHVFNEEARRASQGSTPDLRGQARRAPSAGAGAALKKESWTPPWVPVTGVSNQQGSHPTNGGASSLANLGGRGLSGSPTLRQDSFSSVSGNGNRRGT